uniref:Secreted protein n=1 Tax=Streptomyces sp. NBC_00003 TaxID=2903608 RepID=A0AAU2V9M3_9ACTN
MEAAILILALLFVAFVALGVYVTVKVVSAAKRGVERTVTQARRTVEDTTLRAKSVGQPGVAGQLAQLRLSLRTSMRATQDALHARLAEDESLKESLALFERLSGHGHELDDELRRLEREPDKRNIAARMPELRERTERITHSADSLRWAALDRARQFADDDLASLSDQIEMESGALRDWSTKGPTTGESASWSDLSDNPAPVQSTPSQSNPSQSEPSSSSSPSSERGAGARPKPSAQAPQAIGAAEPPVAYPWQKAPRPETTS